MKTKYGIGLVVVFLIAIISCTKEKIVTQQIVKIKPSLSDSLDVILAGEAGSSKSWRVSSASFTVNGGSSNSITLAACVLDNTYKFTNNSAQNFTHYEGTNGVTGVVKCNSADSTVAEKGNWALTNDGKSLVVEGEWFDDLSQESEYLFFFTANGGSLKVNQLTDTSLTVSYSFIYDGNTYVVTTKFTKV